MAAKKETPKSWENQTVKVKLFKDTERYKDDVTVVVNGKVWRIQRGKEVDLPMFVWKVVEKGLAQDFQTASLIQAEEESFKSKEKDFT